MRNYRFKVKRNRNKNILGMRVMFKKCSKCGEILFRDKFYTYNSPSGLTSNCVNCIRNRHTYTCEICGKEFNTNNKKQKCCSVECMGKWRSLNLVGENSPLYNRVKYNCDYCGKEIEINKYKYNNNKNHFCSRECLNKWKSENIRGENHPCYGREGLKGENNPNYNPNKTQEKRELERQYPEYNDWRKEVFERDNYTCQCCGKKGGNLNAHHIYGYAEYKDLRTDVDNGVILCEDCHKRYHKQYGKKNNNYKDFRTFLYNEMMKQNTLEAKLFYINTIEDITLRLEIRGLLELESA